MAEFARRSRRKTRPLERERQLNAECDALKAAKQALHWQDDAARIADKVLSIQVQVPMLYRAFGLSRLTRHAGLYGGSPGAEPEPAPWAARRWRRVGREAPIREPETHHDGSGTALVALRAWRGATDQHGLGQGGLGPGLVA